MLSLSLSRARAPVLNGLRPSAVSSFNYLKTVHLEYRYGMVLMRGDMGTILWIPEFRSRHADLKGSTVISSLLAIAQFKLPHVAPVTPLYENVPRPKAT